MHPVNLQKQKVFSALITTKPSVSVHFNTKTKGVAVPLPLLRSNTASVLSFGHHIPYPTLDLIYNKKGICGSVSLNGNIFKCFLPWDSVYAIVDPQNCGHVWETYMPLHMYHEYLHGIISKQSNKHTSKPHLHLVQ